MSTSTAGHSSSDIFHKKPLHHYRKDSDEIDVFEAARYFSGYSEPSGGYNYATYNTPKVMSQQKGPWRRERMSMDMPVRDILPLESHQMQKQKKEIRKQKQPSSPAGKLASFLNSLFNQASLKKKKPKSMGDEDEKLGGKRWRRSSISHFGSTTPANSRSAVYPSSMSGFRTPPPYALNGYNDCGSYSDHMEVTPFSINRNGHVKPTRSNNERNRNIDMAWLDEKFRLNHGLTNYQECKKHDNDKNFLDKDKLRTEKYTQKKEEVIKLEEIDDGAESDSSADLFELQNYDLGYYPSGLPVYETTKLDSVKNNPY